ncbi:MAG: PspC domain-containing protein [Clostridiales bacterium]|nr:PspC domain-containing protein [Clostridiales bacterium]
MKKKIYRDTANGKISGVCSGIAKYLDTDATVIRLLWAVAICFFGSGILLYIICAIIIPPEPAGYNDYNDTDYNEVDHN